MEKGRETGREKGKGKREGKKASNKCEASARTNIWTCHAGKNVGAEDTEPPGIALSDW